MLVLLVASCGHSAPFTTAGDYGAIGPQVPGPVAQLTSGAAMAPSWTPDGGGILYQFDPRDGQVGDIYVRNFFGTLIRRDSLDVCVGLLPAQGGSRVWNLCDGQFREGDSTNLFSAVAIDANGRLLYQEATGRADFPVPAGFHAEFWLADTAVPFARRKLLTLYHDSSGAAVAPTTTVNWFAAAAWAGPTTFVAIGQHLNPDNSLATLGIVVGTINAAGATLTVLPGTAAVHKYSVADGGANVVFVDTTLSLWSAPVRGGTPTVVAALPATKGRRILDVSCAGAVCTALTQDSIPAPGTITLLARWTVTRSTGAVSAPSALPASRTLNDAAISPVSHAVVGQSGTTLYLITPPNE